MDLNARETVNLDGHMNRLVANQMPITILISMCWRSSPFWFIVLSHNWLRKMSIHVHVYGKTRLNSSPEAQRLY